jgi:hypothetical protein
VPRALTIQRTIVPAHERKRYLERVRERRAYYQRASCNFWVFEEAALPGAFIEFTEAADRVALSAAHAAAPEALIDPARIYVEVELR